MLEVYDAWLEEGELTANWKEESGREKCEEIESQKESEEERV